MNSVKDPAQETQLDNPIRSPFQLNKTKGPVKLIPLHADLRESGHGTPLSQSTSATSSTSSIGTIGSADIMSPKSALGENPFSFNVQKIGSVNLSPRSSLGGSFSSDSQKLIEHQKEILKLKRDIESKNKDIESKEAKLSSSVKSIKQFWSPELKKERALRKEEVERTKRIKEQFQIGNNQIEEYRVTVQDLEAELCSKQEQIKSLTAQSKDQNTENNNLQNEIKKLKEKYQDIDELHEKLTDLEDSNRRLVIESSKKSTTISELEEIININRKKEEDHITTEKKLQSEYQAHKETRQVLEKFKEEGRKLQGEYRVTVQDLEAELCSKQEQIKSLTAQGKDQNSEINNLQNELKKFTEKCQDIDALHEKLTDLEDSNQGLGIESRQKSTTISELEEIIKINRTKEEVFITTEKKLQSEYQAHKETRQVLEKYKEEVRKLQGDQSVDEFKKDVTRLEEELAKCKRQTDENWMKKQAEAENLSFYEQQVADLHGDLSTLKDTLTKKEQLYEIAKDDADALQKRERKYSEKVDELEDMFAVKDQECGKLQGKVAILNEEKKKVEEDLKYASHAQQQSEYIYNDLRDAQQNLVKEFDELKDVYESTESKNKDIQYEIVKLLKKIKDFENEEQKLVRENTRLEEEIDRILASQEESKSTLKALKSAEKNLSKELEDKEEKLKEVSEQNNNYEKEKEILVKQNNDIEKENKEFKEKLKTQINENLQLRKAKDELQKDHLVAEESIKELKEENRISNSKSLQMGEKLHHNEIYIADLENELQKAKSVGMSSLILREDLQLKTKEVQELSLKYNNLNKYLSERELALDNCRDEVAELKAETQGYISSNNQLKSQVDEQKASLDRLEKENIRFEKAQEEFVSLVIYEKLKTQFEAMKEKSKNQKKLLEEKDGTLKDLENSLKEREEANRDLEEKLKGSESINMVDKSEVDKIQKEKDELKKEITFLKNKVSTLEKQRIGFSVEEKPLVAKKNLWDELSRKDSRIDELEKLLKEKGRQLTAMKKSKNTEWEKQQIRITESKKIEDNSEIQLTKLKTDNEQKANRISLLEEALREMVAVAKERENIMARYAEVYEEVENKYEEADREYARICFERSITNIKNALLILILCEREALISSMKVSHKGYLDELFSLRQERLMASISEMDTQIAHLESQSPKNKRGEIKQMRQEKENYVAQLKEHNNQCMILNSDGDKVHCIANELKEAPSEQVYEAIRQLSHTNNLLESKVEEFLTFLRDKNAELLKDIAEVPVRKVRPNEQLKILPKDELMKELMVIEDHSANLQKFVEDLLTLLEGDQ